MPFFRPLKNCHPKSISELRGNIWAHREYLALEETLKLVLCGSHLPKKDS